jgi:hypothetical protein
MALECVLGLAVGAALGLAVGEALELAVGAAHLRMRLNGLHSRLLRSLYTYL